MKSKLTILIIGLLFILFGSVLAIPEILRMRVEESIEKDYNFQKSSYVYYIDGKKKIYLRDVEVFYEAIGDHRMIIDTYFYSPLIEKIEVKAKNYNHNIRLVVEPKYQVSFEDLIMVHERITSELKQKSMYDYRRLYQPKTVVRIDQKYKHLLEIEV